MHSGLKSADREYFYSLAEYVKGLISNGEEFLMSLDGENSDFVRFNRCLIRQGGSVSRYDLTLTLTRGSRHASYEIPISGVRDDDRAALSEIVTKLREQILSLPEDPHFLCSTEPHSTEDTGENRLRETGEVLEEITSLASGKDLVGILASGCVVRAFANSFGQRNWFKNYNYNFDFSLYYSRDKAVKSCYAGFQWDSSAFKKKMEEAIGQVEVVSRPPKTIKPGKYRVYLAPAALAEFTDIMAWKAFGLKAHKTKGTCLIRMVEKGEKFHPSVSMCENTVEGVAPGFQAEGFLKPDRVSLIEKGSFKQCLISPRSAKEYGLEHNGASSSETPVSFEMSAGEIPRNEIPERLDNGVYVNNAWYLNYSDISSCRITGMTRFASFLVKNGRIHAPLNVMRFDDTIYRMLGENLIGLTGEREFMMDTGTYGKRGTGSNRLPGALIKDFTFTL